MPFPGRFLNVLFSLLALASASASPAIAVSNTGTHAWSTTRLILRSGPGVAYPLTGRIAEEQAIKVLRCQRIWCLVDGDDGQGWVSKDLLSFGKTPTGWPGGLNPDYPSGGPGTICFFTGIDYTGQSLCVSSGRVIRDLALAGTDNRFASVRVTGNVSAAVCRDRDFQSYCERIIASQPVLHRYLRHNASSIRVY